MTMPGTQPLAERTHGGLVGASWRHLSEQLGRAICAVRAVHDLRHRTRIVFPGHLSQGTGRAAVRPGEAEELVRLPVYETPERPGRAPTAGQQVSVLVSKACDADGIPLDEHHALPTVLLFYSAEMHLAMTLPYVQMLRRRGLNVAVAEYVGYGASSGEPSERGCYATADAALEYLLDRPDIEPSRIILMGAGLGAAVATELAAHHEVAGLVCLSPFTSMLDLLRWRLPQRTLDVLVRQKFDTAEKMKLVRCPVMVVHAEDDQIIPAEMSEKLLLSTRSICRRIAVAGSTLHGIELLADADGVLEPVCRFIQEARPRLLTAQRRRAPMVTTRPLAIRPPAPAPGDPGIPEACSEENPGGWRLSFPAQSVPVRYPKPVSRAC